MTIKLVDTDTDAKKAAEAKLDRSIKEMIAHIELTAKLRWLSYNAHRAQGFSRTEALVLCQKMTL